MNATNHHAITNNVGSSTTFVQMVYDAAGPQFNANIVEESPNPTAQNFYDMLNAANQEVWPNCQTHSQLSAIAQCFTSSQSIDCLNGAMMLCVSL